jgi:hypothetical protein
LGFLGGVCPLYHAAPAVARVDARLVVPLFDPIIEINQLQGIIDTNGAVEAHQRPEAEAVHVKLNLTVPEVADDTTDGLAEDDLRSTVCPTAAQARTESTIGRLYSTQILVPLPALHCLLGIFQADLGRQSKPKLVFARRLISASQMFDGIDLTTVAEVFINHRELGSVDFDVHCVISL